MGTELTPSTRQAVVLDIARLAREKYIFSEKGRETSDFLLQRLEQGHYDHILYSHQLADCLTADLRQASHDQHWLVSYDSALTKAIYAQGESEADLEQLKTHLYRANFGIETVEHLPGNIGYVDVREFSWIGFPGAGETIVAAMQLVSHCDALIFDMRRNQGGEVETLQLYISYFVKPDPQLYDSFYYRPTDKTQQLWTMPYVPGNRMPEVPLYVLTSGATGSGGEAFAYILKSMGRATVIGERTLGAAHTTDMEIVQEHFQVEFPSGRSISPFTQGDWEGGGVVPDLAVPAADALKTAHLAAFEKLLEACSDDQRRTELAWDMEIARASYAPIAMDESILARHAGQYGDRSFNVVNGSLAYSRQGNPPIRLVSLAEHRFLYPNGIKFEFAPDDSVTIFYQDGRPAITVARGNP